MASHVLVTALLVITAVAGHDCQQGTEGCDAADGVAQESRSMLSRASRVSDQSANADGNRHQHLAKRVVVKRHGAYQITTFRDGYTRADGRKQWLVCLPEGCDDSITHKLASECLPPGVTLDWEGKPDENGLCCVGVAGSEEGIRGELDNCKDVLPDHAIIEQDQVVQVPEQSDQAKTSLLEEPAQDLWGLDRIDERLGPDDGGLDGDYSPPADGAGVHIFVADTGIRTSHTDFGGRAVPAFVASHEDEQMRECEPQDLQCAHDDDNGHGTHCAATAGGEMFGVAKKASIYAMKVLFGSEGRGGAEGVAESFEFVLRKTALRPAVVSASLGGHGWSAAIALATEALTKAGVPVVVAAGNNGDWPDDIFGHYPVPFACAGWPANVPSAITVGATGKSGVGKTDERASYSSWDSTGPGVESCVDIFAPGSAIKSAWSTGDNATHIIGGTSMATPHVSGAIALLFEENPTQSAHEVEKHLKARATKNAVKDARGSPNLLLYVGSGTTAPAPSPHPGPSQPCFDDHECARVKEMSGGAFTCSYKDMEYWVRIHCAETCGFCPEETPVLQPTPQPTLPKDHGNCVFLQPHDLHTLDPVHNNCPLCADGTIHWHCVTNNHGGRVQCPRFAPYMCADKACDGGNDYCCEDTEAKCDVLYGGLRRCESA